MRVFYKEARAHAGFFIRRPSPRERHRAQRAPKKGTRELTGSRRDHCRGAPTAHAGSFLRRPCRRDAFLLLQARPHATLFDVRRPGATA